MEVLLDPDDSRLLRGVLKGQKLGFAFSLYLTLTFGVCAVACIYAATAAEVSPAFILLGFGFLTPTYFLARTTWKNWKQGIYPLQFALRSCTKKTVVSGRLNAVSLSRKGGVRYEIGGELITTHPVLLHNGLALLSESIKEIDALLHHNVSLHLFVMPDGRYLLLYTQYAAQEMDRNASTYRIQSRTQIGSRASRYFLYTAGYLLLLFVVLFVVPIGIILGIVPVTVGYILVLRNEMKRQRKHSKLQVYEHIKGTITEIIKTRARVQVLGEPISNNYDTWLRIDGKPYLIKSDQPLSSVAVGDGIELVIS